MRNNYQNNLNVSYCHLGYYIHNVSVAIGCLGYVPKTTSCSKTLALEH